MDHWNLSHAVVAPSDDLVAVRNEEGNCRMMALMQAYPDRFSGLAAANPWYGQDAVSILHVAFEQGLVGLYLNPARQGFRLTESIVDPLIETCAAYGKPVYSSTGTPVCAMPFQLAELARRHPQVRFVMGHSAWSDFSGYDVILAAKQAGNILVETSCTTGGLVKAIIGEIGETRVVFGSGYPRSHPLVEIGKIQRLGLAQSTMQRVMSENARDLWGLRQ